jgi:hypothetical protein
MHADRIDCSPAGLAVETQRIVMMVLLSSDSGPWSRTDLHRGIKGSKGEPIDVARRSTPLRSRPDPRL